MGMGCRNRFQDIYNTFPQTKNGYHEFLLRRQDWLFLTIPKESYGLELVWDKACLYRQSHFENC